MMATAFKVLLTALLLIGLVAVPAAASEMDRATQLIDKINAYSADSRELDAELLTLEEQIAGMDPTGPRAAEALPLFAAAQDCLAGMRGDAEACIPLWEEVIALDVSDEMSTYASQQRDVAATHLLIYDNTAELLTRYAILFDADKINKMDRAEVKETYQEIVDIEAQAEDLATEVTAMEQAARQYLNEHDFDETGAGGRSWISWVVGLTIASASALICGLVARKKNRTVIGWGVFGFFIPFPALIAIFVVRRVDLEPHSAALLQPRT